MHKTFTLFTPSFLLRTSLWVLPLLLAGVSRAQVCPTPTISATGATTICAGGSVTLSAPAGSINMPTLANSAAAAANPVLACDCPTGYVAVGYTGRVGAFMDAAQLACKQLNSDGTLGTTVVYTSSTGMSTGGGPVGPYLLGTNTVMVGARVGVYTGSDYLTELTGYGQTVAYVTGNGANSSGATTLTSMSSGLPSSYLGPQYVPNGSVITGMEVFQSFVAVGVRFHYTPIAQLLVPSTYTWSPATGLNTTTGSTVVATPTATTTYTLTATSGPSCLATATQTVTVTSESVWNGSTSTDWYNAANWTGCVPSLTINGRLPAGRPRYPSLTAGTTAAVRSLVVENGASLALNTATLRVADSFVNQNTAALTLTGSLKLEGSSPALTNVATVNNIDVNTGGGTATLSRALTVNGTLTLSSGLLNTGAFAISLSPTAVLNETESSYVVGSVATTRTLFSGTGNSFGGLGLTLTPAAGSVAPGATAVTRVTGTALTGAGNSQGVQRYFSIAPAVNAGLNVNMLFGYWDHELNGISEADLWLFRSENGAAGPWQPHGHQGLNATANTLARTGIAAFSTWTLGAASAPLPVELAAFTAESSGADALLRWTTASELNNDRFEIESSADGRRFARIGVRAGQGNAARPTAYEFRDATLSRYGAATVYYRLRQVDTNGQTSYSPMRAVMQAPALPGNLAAVALPTPYHDHLTVRVTSSTAGPATWRVLNAVGQPLLQGEAQLPLGTTDLPLNEATKLPAGCYFLELVQGPTRHLVKLMRL